MAKRLTDYEKWEDLVYYFERHSFRYNKWIVAKGLDISRLKEKPGCYVVYSKGVLVYIGQSNSPRFRMAQHLSRARQEGYESPWGSINYLLVKRKEAMLEKRLIRKLKPRLNFYIKSNKRAYRRS
jgi:excinuclease UvrABC nuclease subunit